MHKKRFLLLLFCVIPSWGQTQFQTVDVSAVRASGDPSQWVRTITVPPHPQEINCDVLVAGGGMGGVAAAMRAARMGNSVCITEESAWVGGQLTAGGVSAFDENRFIEFSGGTRTYYALRRGIRDYYRSHYTLAPEVQGIEDLNPGSCYVSPLCFEPPVGVNVLNRMIASVPGIRLFMRTKIIDLTIRNGVIESALAFDFEKNSVFCIRTKFVLDATETGELLPMAHVPYSVGSEAKSDTHEKDAGETPNKGCVQSFTYPFIIEHKLDSSAEKAARPPDYDAIVARQKFSLLLDYPTSLGWVGQVQYTMYGEDPPIPNNQSPRPFFGWRRVLAGKNFIGPNRPNDLALVNWPRQDYADESILDRGPLDQARILQNAKRVSLAFLYWLQNDVPRDDGKGTGYPELALRTDEMGTADGLSMTPYIRESRRLRGRSRITEEDIGSEFQKGSRARWVADSIGTGFYMIDIHPCGAGEHGHMTMPKPFQIPMGALVPDNVSNLLAAGKNISITHITNGALRLHPVEWNVGEAAGVIASLAIRKSTLPETFEVQQELAADGVPLVWFDDLSPDSEHFAAIQITAIAGMYPLSNVDLHASPDAPITRREAVNALAALFGVTTAGKIPLDVEQTDSSAKAIATAIGQGWMATDHRNWFHPDLPFYWTDLRQDRFPHAVPAPKFNRFGPVRRDEFAEFLAQALRTIGRP